MRIRIKENKRFITVKGIGNQSGTTCFEWEKEISVKDANDLLKICEPGVINKIRYHAKSGRHTFEVDEFYGENNGLIIAEVELDFEEESFNKPDCLGEEVTGNMKYYNSMLIKNPYTNWK